MEHYQPTLKTERLVLRPFELTDAKAVQQLAGTRAVADTTSSIPHPYENGMAQKWIAGHARLFRDGKAVHFAITKRDDARFVGTISLMDLQHRHRAEFGFWIGRPFWNLGYCTEAATAVLKYAFEVLSLNRVYASHFTRNPASGRILLKLGMEYEGCLRDHEWKWEKFESLKHYGILKRDWERRKEQYPWNT